MVKYLEELLDWCKVKIFLFDKTTNTIFKEGDIWWCSVGLNVGVEIMGKGNKFLRPVLIFKKLSPDSFLGIPLTTQDKEGTWYVPIKVGERVNRAIIAQIRVFDKKRLVKNMNIAISANDLTKIRISLTELYLS